MKNRILLVLCMIVTLPNDTTAGSRPITIVAFGNSLSAGYGVPSAEAYPAQLERLLRAAGHECRVLNAGISGETSSGALRRLDRITGLTPDIVILETGINDIFRGIPLEKIHANIGTIIGVFKRHRIRVILAGFRSGTYTGLDHGGEAAALFATIAREETIPLIPSFLEAVAGIPSLNLGDRVHPNGQGYRQVARNVFAVVHPLVKEVEAAGRFSP